MELGSSQCSQIEVHKININIIVKTGMLGHSTSSRVIYSNMFCYVCHYNLALLFLKDRLAKHVLSTDYKGQACSKYRLQGSSMF